MKWLVLAVWLVLLGIVVTRIALPLAVRLFSSFRLTASELSPWRVRGVEWRIKSHAASLVPSWRVELVSWSLGGPDAPGKLTLNVEGVTIRLHKKHQAPNSNAPDAEEAPKKKKRQLPWWLQTIVDYFLHLLLHHWITAAGFLSVRITDVRVIVEELDDLEVRLGNARLAFGQDTYVPPPYQPPLQPDEYSARHATPSSQAAEREGLGTPVGRARRHAPSPSISQMSKTVWSHAIGNAIGRMAFSLRVDEATVLIPQRTSESPSSDPAASRAPCPATKELLPSLNSLLTTRIDPRLRPSEEGYSKVVMLESPSDVHLSLGIGPATHVFDKDNLRIDAQLGALQVSLDGVEKFVATNKERKMQRALANKTPSQMWAEGSIARRAVLALESVTFSCQQASVYHVLPVLQPDPPVQTSEPYGHTMSLDFSALSVRLAATHNGLDSRLANIFGNSQNVSSRVHGITTAVSWRAIELQCIAPGETLNDKTQLAAIRQADFDLLTTWRPVGFERREMLFSEDPDLSIIIARGCVASLDVAGDLQLLSELARSWRDMHPATPKAARVPRPKRKHLPKPPRVRLFVDLGHMSIIIANSASEDSATMSFSSDGVSFGGTSCFDDHAAAALANAHSASTSSGWSGDDYGSQSSREESATFGMTADMFAVVEPLHLRLSLGSRNENTYKLAKIGRISTKIVSHISGNHRTLESGLDDYRLLQSTLATDVEVLIDDGIKMEIWHPEVISAITQLASLKKPATAPKVAKSRKEPLDILPAGLSIRLAVGVVSVFIGHQDLNPRCDTRLVRGIWLQTAVVFDYARFPTMKARGSTRHLRNLIMRDRLKLFKDVTSSAFDHTDKLEHRGAQAALFSLLLRDTAVKTVFNGDAFVEKGGTEREMPAPQPDAPRPEPADPGFAAWGWNGSKRREKVPRKLHLSHLPKAYLSPNILYIPHVHFTAKIHQPHPDEGSQVQLYGRVELIHFVTYISDLYSALLAVHTVQIIGKAFKNPPVVTKNDSDGVQVNPDLKPPIPITFGLAVHKVWLHFYFPLQEQAFFAFENVGVERGFDKSTVAKSDHVVLFIPSDTQPGMWDELGRIKRLALSIDPSHAVSVNAMAFRIRIPYAFIFSQLIFNINMAIKTTKLILHNLRTGTFSLVKKPLSEPPKRMPLIKIHVDLLHFEARDHPVENKINLANRVGLLEQKARLDLDEMFEHKVALLSEENELRAHSNLTRAQSVTNEEARYRLDWHFSRNWVRRIRRAKAEQRRREDATHKRMTINKGKLPIPVLELEQTVPLFRFAFVGVDVTLAPPNKSRAELIKYMGDVSAPFKDDVQFSLMVPFHLTWTMAEAKVTLRDYPLPLLRIQPGPRKTPGWHVTTLFIIAEELSDDDSTMFFPIEVVPGRRGHELTQSLTVQIGKAIMPVKTYARPMIKVLSPEATRLTWCNSYKPGLSDLSRIFESLSNPPLDPSLKPGFWDKLRLAFHWRIIVDFTGSVRWYLKGSHDPYAITGFGAGFALVWRRNVCIEIGQPNSQRELVQVMADELLISIPDLTVLVDQAAVGVTDEQPDDEDEADQKLIERRSTKPCARFLNGVRFGLGFVFERTCRWWSCNKCGKTENLLHRQCRIFDFRPHNTVVLKNPKVAERLALEAGHPVDSYERFRSDYIHFSVSLVTPREPGGVSSTAVGSAAVTHSSIHMNPKAFAHFFNWWSLFRSKIPSPIRQGRAFPDSPVSSSKIGGALATIKYRCDIAPIYVSHMYNVYSEELWSKGLGQSLGLKFRAGRFRLDGHQRQQEQRQFREALKKVQIVTHKPFYACDLLLDEITFKGMVADFNEAHISPDATNQDDTHPHASDLSEEGKVWYNYFDFIDADSKPFDRNPRVQVVHMGDCPHIFLSRRVKALRTKPFDEAQDLPPGKEASKFGHEKTHVCYLGAALGVGPMQSQIAQERVVALQEVLVNLPDEDQDNDQQYINILNHRINILKHHIDDLAQTETRHMDNSTLANNDSFLQPNEQEGDTMFDNTLHVHCPRLFFNNQSRNVLYKYLYCRKNRKREEYTTSYAALRAIRDGVNQRRLRHASGLNRDDVNEAPADEAADEAAELLKGLEKRAEDGLSERYVLSEDFLDEQGTFALPEQGLPPDCDVHPKWRILVLKPQIALRSTVDPTAIVLVALQEMAMKSYNIIDTKALDSVVSEVLSRTYVAAKGLQAFYPTMETMARSLKTWSDYRELDFVPLEIFLDVKSEATDYDRIILRADMGVSWDEFNHLRTPRGLEWPEAYNEFGDPIEHLRLHQNMTAICMPMLTVAANATHWTALYYVMTDLLIYTLPEKRSRKQKVDGFLLQFDRRNRDPQQLLWSLFIIQQHMRNLAELQRGYQSNLERLTPEGKRELFNIRADLLHEYEALNTVFDVINLNRSYEEARDALQTKSRIDVRAGNIAWHMLREGDNPLLKLNIKHALFAMDHNQDGSKDLAVAVSDLQALNSNAEALFTEVLTKTAKDVSRKKIHSTCFMSASFSTLPQVGGISIVKELAFYLHPVRFRLEQTVGTAVVDYLFNDKTKQHMGAAGHASSTAPPRPMDSLPPSRTQSSATLATAAAASRSTLAPLNDRARADVDAEEMRRRAAENRTYMNLAVGATYFVLDYKRDESKKHGLIPDVADFKLSAPELNYKDKVWSGKDILEEVKRDLIKSVWSQRGDLVSQMMMKTSMFRSKKSLRQIAGLNTEVEKHSKISTSPMSPLRFSVQPSTPLDMDDFDPPSPGSFPTSTASTPGARMGTDDTITPRNVGHRPSLSHTNVNGGDADDEGESTKGKRMGLFGRLRRPSRGADDTVVQPRSRLASASEGGGFASRGSTPQRTGDYSGGASLRSTHPGLVQSPSPSLDLEVQRQVSRSSFSNGN